MKPSELIPVLKMSLQKQWPILTLGTPGSAKTELVMQVANDLKYELQIEHAVTSESIDYKGLPCVKDGLADFLPYASLRKMIETKEPLIVFFDDIGQAPNSVQSALMQVLLAREVAGKKISDTVSFCACSNGRLDGANVQGIITPLINRFRAILTLDINSDDWISWASKNSVPIELIAFIQFRPQLLNTFNPKAAKNIKPFSSPRSIKFLGDWLLADIHDVNVWSACVGEDVATEFYGFYKIYSEVSTLIPQILLNPKKAPLLEKADQIYSIVSALAYKATDVNIDSIATYLERINSNEFIIFGWKMMTGRDPNLNNTKAFQEFSIKHSNDLK